jgi:hypothetical protein
MPLFPSSCVARFATKMHPDTVAILFCLLLVTLGIGHTIVSSGVVPKVIDCLSECFDELYWEVNYLYWNICYEYSNNGIPTWLRVLGLLTVGVCTPRVLAEFLLKLGVFSVVPKNNLHELAERGESQNTKKAATPASTPVIPAPPTLAQEKPAPPAYPPPSQFPFKNFCGTGESFAHLDRNRSMQYPKIWGQLRCADRRWMAMFMYMPGAYMSTDDKNVDTEDTTSKPQHVAESATNNMKDDVVVTPAHKAVELSVRSAPTTTPTPSAYTLAPSCEPQTTTTFTPATVYNCLQTANSARITIEYHARQAPILQAAMKAFLIAADTKTECRSSAGQIFSLISSAANDLKPYFENGMTAEQSSGLRWNASIIEFWMFLVPVGWYIQRYWGPELITFLELYREFANYLGLEEMTQDLDCTEPLPSPQALQIVVQSTQTPRDHPPQVAQMPSWSTPQRNVAVTISNQLMSYQPVVQQQLPQPPPSGTQFSPASNMQTPPHNAMATGYNPTTADPIASQSQNTPNNTDPSSVQSQTLPPVDFKDINTWSGLSHKQLEQLVPSSFGFKTDMVAGDTFWKFTASVDFHEILNGKAPKQRTPDSVKASLEKVALSFKRAAVVLRLQAKLGDYSKYSDTSQPTISDITALIKRAAQMTDACGGLAKNDASLRNWKNACVFFHNAVYCEDKEVGDILDRHYDDGVWPRLERTWEKNRMRWMDN